MHPRYSTRLPWTAQANSLEAAVDRQRRSGMPLFDLTLSNPTVAGIEFPPVFHALADERALVYEPSPRGLADAREAVSTYYNGLVSPSRILLTASTSEGYSYLFKLLCDPGDEVLVPRPSYPLFEMLAGLEGVKVVEYALRYHEGWFVDLPALTNSLTNRTRAIISINPNNPTGSYLKDFEHLTIAEICRSRGLALISDEVFADYPFDPDSHSLRTLVRDPQCLTFVLSGLSKVCGLPQMKLGWIAAGGPGHEEALRRLEWIADAFLSVGAPVQHATPALLESRHSIQAQIRERTATNLSYIRSAVDATDINLLRVEGGWSAVLRIPNTRSEVEWVTDLIQRGTIVQPGFYFNFESEGFLVLSLLTPPSVFKAGFRHILDSC